MEREKIKENLKFSNFSENPLNRNAVAFDKISRNCGLLWKFNKYTLTRVFLHGEFISAMKTVQNPTVFMKTQK